MRSLDKERCVLLVMLDLNVAYGAVAHELLLHRVEVCYYMGLKLAYKNDSNCTSKVVNMCSESKGKAQLGTSRQACHREV